MVLQPAFPLSFPSPLPLSKPACHQVVERVAIRMLQSVLSYVCSPAQVNTAVTSQLCVTPWVSHVPRLPIHSPFWRGIDVPSMRRCGVTYVRRLVVRTHTLPLSRSPP